MQNIQYKTKTSKLFRLYAIFILLIPTISFAYNITPPQKLLSTQTSSHFSTSDEPTINLFDKIPGKKDAGGTWSDDDNSNAITPDGILSPCTLTPGIYRFTYTVSSNGPCGGSASSVVTVKILPPPSAGNNNTITVCSDITAVNLFEKLGGIPSIAETSSGIKTNWKDNNKTNAISADGIFNPSKVPTGIYSFTYKVSSFCHKDSATIQVIVSDKINAGIDTAITVATNSATIDLFEINDSSITKGGTWRDNSGILSGSTFNPKYADIGIYQFTYTISASESCSSDTSSTTTITVIPQKNKDQHPTTKIEEITNVTVYPNPVGNYLNIKSNKEIAQVNIISGTGAFVSGKKVSTKILQLDMQELSPGTYFIRLIIDKEIVTKKITKR